jgi:hypothetical protein
MGQLVFCEASLKFEGVEKSTVKKDLKFYKKTRNQVI